MMYEGSITDTEDNTDGEPVTRETGDSLDWNAVLDAITAFSSRVHTDAEVRIFTDELGRRFPSHHEAISALTSFTNYLETELTVEGERGAVRGSQFGGIKRSKEEKQEHLDKLISLAEYQFLLTHLIVSTLEDEDDPLRGTFARNFWDTLKTIADNEHGLGNFEKLKEGILAQASIYHLLTECGKKPVIAHPKEDTKFAVDLWSDDHTAVQVKGAPARESFDIVPVGQDETVSFPGIRFGEDDREGKVHHYNAHSDYTRGVVRHMTAQLGKLSAAEQRPIAGYVVVIPRGMRDSMTGVPDAEVIAAARTVLSEREV